LLVFKTMPPRRFTIALKTSMRDVVGWEAGFERRG